tara:strand:+ start:2090 stop:2503 length:414 start_codon:yes stop_codon:yes gene_type:complete
MILQETSLSYSVPTGQGTFKFTVSSNKFGAISVSSITRDNISVIGSYPLEVQQAVSTAISKLEIIMANISTLSGVISFANQSEKSVVFDSPMPNTDYRVLFSVDDFVFVRVKSRTTTGFVVELSTAFTGSVMYDIIV